CFFKWLGLRYCPGCGIGHAINAALHFQFENSFNAHPAGIFAIGIIFQRIIQLAFIKKNFQYEQ
ncbi:MAG: DUF2752 domain-containing protein, partial [Ferruginibacter sp.]